MAIKQPVQFIKQTKRIYSDKELEEFFGELDKYKIWGKHPFEDRMIKYISVGGEFSYLQDKGIIKSYKKIKPEMKTMSDLPNWVIVYKRKDDFIEHENKMRQYFSWRAGKERRTNFTETKNLEEWDKIAKTMPEISSCEKNEEITTEDVDKLFCI